MHSAHWACVRGWFMQWLDFEGKEKFETIPGGIDKALLESGLILCIET